MLHLACLAAGGFSMTVRAPISPRNFGSTRHETRFNNRENPYLFLNTMVKLVASKKLEYRTLKVGSRAE